MIRRERLHGTTPFLGMVFSTVIVVVFAASEGRPELPVE